MSLCSIQISIFFRVIQEKLPEKIAISPDNHLPCNIYKWSIISFSWITPLCDKIGTNDWYKVQAYQVPIVNPRWAPISCENVVKYDNWCTDCSLCDKKKQNWYKWLFVTTYRVQAYQVPIVNPGLPPKIQNGRQEI